MSTLTHMPRERLLLVTSVIIAVAMLFAHVIKLSAEVDEEASVGAFVGFSIFAIGVTAVLLLVAVPAIPREYRRLAVLGFGAGALITMLAFSTGLPFALGAAALYAAGPGEERIPAEGEAFATAGVILAVLGMLGAFVLCIIS